MSSSPNQPISDELLSAYLDDSITESERQAVETALKQNSDVRWRLETLRYTVRLLNQLPEINAPRTFALTDAIVEKVGRPAPIQRRTPASRAAEPLSAGLWPQLNDWFSGGNLLWRNAALISFAALLTLFVVQQTIGPVRELATSDMVAEQRATVVALAPEALPVAGAESAAVPESSTETGSTETGTSTDAFAAPDAEAADGESAAQAGADEPSADEGESSDEENEGAQELLAAQASDLRIETTSELTSEDAQANQARSAAAITVATSSDGAATDAVTAAGISAEPAIVTAADGANAVADSTQSATEDSASDAHNAEESSADDSAGSSPRQSAPPVSASTEPDAETVVETDAAEETGSDQVAMGPSEEESSAESALDSEAVPKEAPAIGVADAEAVADSTPAQGAGSLGRWEPWIWYGQIALFSLTALFLLFWAFSQRHAIRTRR